MRERILGIDTGTNSIGWAIVDYDNEALEYKYTLIDKGVNIFQEGVKIEKGIESSKAADRSEHKHQRVGYWRRKIRKIKLLRLLIDNKLCPPLSAESLKKWRLEKEYPQDEDFMAWQRTDDNENKNPYYYRNLCLTEKLDLSDITNRYKVGRAIYHLNQRRGFLSNRKEEAKSNDGTVKKDIDAITLSIKENGMEYLGQYFYMLYQKKEKIRSQYTSRTEHYEKELLAICRKQGLSEELTNNLRETIITQRPLKSQKYNVGKCVFEPSKPRCPISHPLYEQYRMYTFINNIKMQGPKDSVLRMLTKEEKDVIIPLFLKSKKDFKFEDIAKKLSGSKKNICYYKDLSEKAYRFNYQMDTTISGCPVISQLSEAFDAKNEIDDWLNAACEVYTLASGKNRYEIMNDIWHVLFFFDDESKLKKFALDKLQMDEVHATLFSKIRIPSNYASLSLKAIRKILPYMKQYGMIYSHAVFMANLPTVIKCETDKDALLPMLPREDAEDIVKAFYEYNPSMSAIKTQEEYVKRYIAYKYNLDENAEKNLKKLYHPSMIDTFPKVRHRTEKGYFQLGSPRASSMRNPMAMHSLFRLRHVINTLLKEGKIDEDTTIRIEFARELNDFNKRSAIRQWQNELEKSRKEAIVRIKEHFGNSYTPTTTDLLKYKLWEEQGHVCLYTGKKIGLGDLFDSNKFDIEHTIPRSAGGDSTDMNLTVCDSHYNREVKKTLLPSQLSNHESILERIDDWRIKVEKLDKEIRKINTKGISDKETKDTFIQKRHRLILVRDYWKGKYNRFIMTKVPEGFSRRQGVDISVISKYTRLYLKSLFRNVYVVKGIATSDFRKIWGLQEEYEKKERKNHCHHAIDAITIACIGKAEYDKLAQYYHDEECYHWGMNSKRAVFLKPWATFTEDVKHIEDTLLISHYTADNIKKHTRKKIRKNGKITGGYMQGDTARVSLHQDTYYGAIKHNGEIKYVVRKPIGDADPKNIVDDTVREKVIAAISEHGNLKKASEAGIWMNKEKGIKINKVRVFTSIKNPINIRLHRDVSSQKYKQAYHVTNDNNYSIRIYAETDKNGKEKRSYELLNNYDAIRFYKRGIPNFPGKNSSKYMLKWILKKGTMVIFYDKSPDEILNLSTKELNKRLYKVYVIESDGRIRFVHHQEARAVTDIKTESGEYKSNENFRSRIRMSYNQFQALVQGQDFEINDLGKIRFLRK